MDSVWILASIAAAFFQALRYATLKVLNRTLSTTAATYARMLFGMPFLTLQLFAAMLVTDGGKLVMPTSFLVYSALAAAAQFAGSAIIVYAFQLGNFAVATMLVKTDVVSTAVLGMLLFAQPISVGGWIAIAITLIGVIVTSSGRLPPGALGHGRIRLADLLVGRAARVALLAAIVYSISYLLLREAIVGLGPEVGGPAVRAAWVGVVMTGMTVVIMGAWLLVREPQAFRQMLAMPAACTFLGLVSALGTIFWFFASALTNAAYVAAVAQVQIAFTLAISHFYFNERLRPLEFIGIAIILCGVLIFRFA